MAAHRTACHQVGSEVQEDMASPWAVVEAYLRMRLAVPAEEEVHQSCRAWVEEGADHCSCPSSHHLKLDLAQAAVAAFHHHSLENEAVVQACPSVSMASWASQQALRYT